MPDIVTAVAGPRRSNIVIRAREPRDDAVIRALNDAAFGGTCESRLIDELRAAGLAAVELVAVDEAVVGHILFSALGLTLGDRTVRALALAPMSVRPDRAQRGIGRALVRAGLQLARCRAWQAVIVVGHAAYYPRFGFSAELARPLAAPFSGAEFMALELAPGILQGGAGVVTYPPAFAAIWAARRPAL